MHKRYKKHKKILLTFAGIFFILGVFLVGVFFVLGMLTPEIAQARMSPHRWPAGVPVVIESRLGNAWQPHVRLVGEKWDNKSGPISFQYTQGQAGCAGDVPLGRIVVCWVQLGGWTADANPRSVDHNIKRCRIRLDPDRTMAKGFYRVLSHELGHCLGLEHHNVTKNSVMYPHDDVLAEFATEFDGNSLRILYNLNWNTQSGQEYSATHND